MRDMQIPSLHYCGTIFQDTRTPFTVWFRAMLWVAAKEFTGEGNECHSRSEAGKWHVVPILNSFVKADKRRFRPVVVEKLLGISECPVGLLAEFWTVPKLGLAPCHRTQLDEPASPCF